MVNTDDLTKEQAEELAFTEKNLKHWKEREICRLPLMRTARKQPRKRQ